MKIKIKACIFINIKNHVLKNIKKRKVDFGQSKIKYPCQRLVKFHLKLYQNYKNLT